MLKRLLLLGAVSGTLAGIACLVYQKAYASSLGADFSKIAKPAGIMISCIVGWLLAALGYSLLNRFLKNKTEVVFNFNCLSALGEWFFRGYYVVERHWSCYHCLLNHPIE